MKLGSKILFLLKDPDGLSTAIADTLSPSRDSNLRTLEESFELSLDQYGIKDHKASGNLVHYIHPSSNNYELSVILLEKYEPPVLVCALSEVLNQLTAEATSGLSTIIVPFVGASSKLKGTSRSLTTHGSKAVVYIVQIGPETNISQTIATRTKKAPPSLQIHFEPLACLLQLVRVMKLPTTVLVGQHGQNVSEIEALHEMGQHLATITGFAFTGEKIKWSPAKTTRNSEEPWRALYG